MNYIFKKLNLPKYRGVMFLFSVISKIKDQPAIKKN